MNSIRSNDFIIHKYTSYCAVYIETIYKQFIYENNKTPSFHKLFTMLFLTSHRFP